MAKFHWEDIQKLAKAHHIQDHMADVETFERFLQFWWSRKFNRPLKDPLLLSYTLEELAYEWLRNIYMIPENDPKKELESDLQREDEDDWIKTQLSKIKKTEEPKPVEIEVKKEEVIEIPPMPDISTSFD
jgi:hypothetical protein